MPRRPPLLLALLLLFTLSPPAWAKTSFILLPVPGAGVSAAKTEAAMSALRGYLSSSGRYTLVDRDRLAAVMAEQKLQISGVADATRVVELGKILGAEKIAAVEILDGPGDEVSLGVTVVDVATAQVERVLPQTGSAIPEWNAKWLAGGWASAYPLVGTALGVKGATVFVDLGENDGMKPGQRLFVAHLKVERDDSGAVLFSNLDRIGTMRLTEVGPTRSKGTILRLEAGATIQKGDQVSPDPIPLGTPSLARAPLNPQAKPGKLLLDDTMDSQLLAPEGNQGAPYRNGRLYIDADTIPPSWHARVYYGGTLNDSTDFVWESDLRWEGGDNARVTLIFRSNGQYALADGYALYLTQRGTFSFNRWRRGSWENLTPEEATGAMRRGKGEHNTVRIVGVDGRFDLYLNGQFVAGFQDETYERGTFGYLCNNQTIFSVDDVKVWAVAP